MQQINEGRLDIPAGWHDQSVNVYTVNPPGQPGLTVAVNRDRLVLGDTVQDYAQEQLAQITRQLDGFDLRASESLVIDGRPAQEYEFTWRSADSGPVHQLMLCVANGQKVLNLSAVVQGRLEPKHLAESRRIVRSLRFEGPAGEATTEGATT